MRRWAVLLLAVTLSVFSFSLARGGGGGSSGGGSSDKKPYPDQGTIYYQPPKTGSGSSKNNSDNKHLIAVRMSFDNPGNWYVGPARGNRGMHAGILEIDFFELQGDRESTRLKKEYPFFETGCSSYSTLPEYYDDCPTSGVSEPRGKISHGFGSWNASSVSTSRTYWGYIYLTPVPDETPRLSRRDGSEFDWSLNWSNQEHDLPGSPRYAPTDSGTTRCYYRNTERNIWCVQSNKGGYLLDSIQESGDRPFRYNRSDTERWLY